MDTLRPELMAELKHWQRRIFASAWITYFAYYLCRLNMPMAKTRLCETFSWDAAAIGIVFSALTLMYAVGQFVNGQLADRFGARAIASLGVLGSVVMNLAVFVVVLVAVPERANPTDGARPGDDPLGRQRFLPGHGLVAHRAADGLLVSLEQPRHRHGAAGDLLSIGRRCLMAPGVLPDRLLCAESGRRLAGGLCGAGRSVRPGRRWRSFCWCGTGPKTWGCRSGRRRGAGGPRGTVRARSDDQSQRADHAEQPVPVDRGGDVLPAGREPLRVRELAAGLPRRPGWAARPRRCWAASGK